MGLAASQGRLLLLTAKKSDLEFRAQSISQSRLVLAQQQESISRKYAEKTSNTSLTFKRNNGDNTTSDVPLLYSSFTSNDALSGKYEIRNSNGSAFRPNSEQATKLANDKGGANSYFKYLLEAGIIQIWEKAVSATSTTDAIPAKQTSIAGSSDFTESYYTDDDANAKATYDMEMLKVKIKDQRLELELKGVETQHKAVETETESVGKIIQKNVEVSFKTFS